VLKERILGYGKIKRFRYRSLLPSDAGSANEVLDKESAPPIKEEEEGEGEGDGG
jgi:hypothetical protein